MNPVDYKSFLEQKGKLKNGDNEQPAMEEKKGPLLTPPRKKKSSLGQPIFIGAVIFLLLISAVGIYYSFSGTNKNQNKNGQMGMLGRASAGKLKPIFVDSDFSIYNEKVDYWTPKKEGEIPFGIKILTGNDSRRNIFAIPGAAHSIRTDSDTKFMFDSSEETTNFKQRIKLVLEEGKIWVEGGGDIFEVTIPRGLIRGDGNDFEIVLINDNAHIYSWNGTLSFVPKNDSEKVIYIDKGKMLFIDKAGNMIPPPPDLLSIGDSKTDWQNWNMLIKSENLLGSKPTVPPIPKKLANEKAIEEMPVEVDKESAKATEPVKPDVPPKQPPQPAPKPAAAHHPPADNRGRMSNTHHTSSAPYQPPAAGAKKGGYSIHQEPPPPDRKSQDTPPPTKPKEKMLNVHSEGSGGTSKGKGTEQPPPSYGRSSSSLKQPSRSVLDNKAKGSTGPPGYGLNEPPVGPSEK